VHGELDRGEDLRTSNSLNSPDVGVDDLGPSVALDSCADHKRLGIPPSSPGSGIDGPVLWQSHLLFDLFVRRFCPWKALLSSRAVLLLVVFHIYEYVLARGARQ